MQFLAADARILNSAVAFLTLPECGISLVTTFRLVADGRIDKGSIGHVSQILRQLLEKNRNGFHKHLPVLTVSPQVD